MTTSSTSLIIRSTALVGVVAVCGLLAFLGLTDHHALSKTLRRRLMAVPSDPATVVRKQTATPALAYTPSSMEHYVADHLVDLGYVEGQKLQPDACDLWKNEQLPIHFDLQTYQKDLELYAQGVKTFQSTSDLRMQFDDQHSNQEEVCRQVDILNANHGSMTSKLSHSDNVGFMEPVLPPFRHPKFCFPEKPNSLQEITNLEYMVHDFASMCRKLKKTSKTILIDMGASIDFHDGDNTNAQMQNPALYLSSLYSKFGMPFDHIYAYEYTRQNTEDVYKVLPKDMEAAYHWINMGVDAVPGSYRNPLTMILNHFTEDDFVAIKLDIDTEPIELALVEQLLADPRLHKLVDQFYFEDHRPFIHNNNIIYMGLNKDVLNMFVRLRELGIAAHPWI